MTNNTTREALAEAAKFLASEAMDIAESAGHPLHGAGTLGRLFEARAELFAAIDALATAAQSEPQWMPIETVPKDGRKLMLFYINRAGKARTVLACWLTDEEAAESDADDVGLEGGWYECIDNWDDYCQVAIHEGEPTHWMPLPQPPKDTQ